MDKRVRRVVTVCILLLLVMLFTLPNLYLTRVCREMTAQTAAAEAALSVGGDPAPALLRLSLLYERHDAPLKLFMDHVSVDAVGAAIAACTPLSEPDALIAALHTVNAALSHLGDIESLTPESLL